MFSYTVNPDSDIPIYRQLVDQINAEIRSGVLKTGAQMPTVREMAESLHLSCGTVKRVYDTLREMGDIEMTRRRGTFVKYVRENQDSRKFRAMHAIDQMIRTLSDMHFSPSEISIFLNLKLREWGLKWSGINISVVTDYTECAGTLESQLSQIGNVSVSIYSLKQVREYPYSVDEQSDVILVSADDAERLYAVMSENEKIVRIAMKVSDESIMRLAQLRDMRVGIMAEEPHFAELVKRYLPETASAISVHGRGVKPEQLLDALIVPGGCSEGLPGFTGNIAVFDWRIDDGSMLYLEERIGRIRDERQLRPGSLNF